MNSLHPDRVFRQFVIAATAAAFALATASTVAAQYQWRDAKGRMVYSDLPPPASVASDQVIRAPSVAPVPVAPASAAPVPAANAPVANGTGPSLADREMAARKRAADLAAEQKKTAEEATRKTQLARACSDAQGNIRMLESGQRISRVNAAGEREFISDTERMQRLTEARKSVGERC